MSNNRDKELNAYYKRIRASFPVYTATEKRFFHDLKDSISEHIEAHPTCSQTDIMDKFGTSQEIIKEYLESIDGDHLYKNLKTARWIRIAVIFCCLCVAIACLLYSFYIHKAYQDSKDAIITKEETTIIEYVKE